MPQIIFTKETSGDIRSGDNQIVPITYLQRDQHPFTISNNSYRVFIQFVNGLIDGVTFHNYLSENERQIDDNYYKEINLYVGDIQEFNLGLNIQAQPGPSKRALQRRAAKKKKQKKTEKRKRQRKLKIREANPLMIPFNVELNNGEGNCVDRMFKNLHKSRYKNDWNGETVDDLIQYCDERKIHITIYNILGKIIYSNNLPRHKRLRNVIALSHNQHLYYNTSKSNKILLNKDVINGEMGNEDDYVYYFNNDNRITDAIYMDKDLKLDELLTENMKGTFCLNVKKILQNIRPLSLNKCEKNAWAIDMNNAYYTTAINHVGHIGIPTIFDKFEDYNNENIKDYNIYIIDEELKEYGYNSNVLFGREIRVFRNNGINITILKHLNFRKFTRFNSGNKIQELYKDDPKAFNHVYGICGMLNKTVSKCVEINDKKELKALDIEEDGEVRGNMFYFDSYKIVKISGYYHFYINIISACKTRVLNQIFSYKKRYGMPVKIKTDSLSYIDYIDIPDGWKREEYKYNNIKAIKFRMCDDTETVYDNITFLGMPGTGKTTKVETNKKFKYEYACAFTNKKARDIGGRTIHKLFNVYTGKPNYHLKDKIIWVDECGMIPDYLWSYFLDAYVNYGTRFIFTGDFKQTKPIEGKPLHKIDFLGKVKELKKNYRMEPQLLRYTTKIRNGDIKWTNSTSPFPLFNICYTNKKRHEVNQKVMEYYNIKPYNKGCKYLTRVNSKKYGIVKSEILTLESVNGNDVKFEELDILVDKKFIEAVRTDGEKTNMDYGYCMTIHAITGDTVEGDIGIHEIEKHLHKYPDLLHVATSRSRKFSNLFMYD